MKFTGIWFWVLATAVLLWSCGTGSMFSKDSSKTKDAQIFYTAEEGLKLYPEARFSPNPLVEMPMHEKVLRHRTEKGFAYVTVERTGQKGWVENARLTWRIEKQRIEPKTAAPEKKEETPPGRPATELPQEDKKPGGAGFPKEAEAATPPETSDQPKSKKKPDASVLDSY